MMIPKAKCVEIAKGLLEKTKQGKVEWRNFSSQPNAFRLQSPQLSFFLNHVSPATEVDYVELQLMGPKGESVGSWKVLEGDPDWGLASELYSEVSRNVLGWDKVLSEVEKFISNK
jgi:hypothetical protein